MRQARKVLHTVHDGLYTERAVKPMIPCWHVRPTRVSTAVYPYHAATVFTPHVLAITSYGRSEKNLGQ